MPASATKFSPRATDIDKGMESPVRISNCLIPAATVVLCFLSLGSAAQMPFVENSIA